jgi:hypothetical protein
LQNGVVIDGAQSAFAWHCTHWPSAEHSFAGAAQSAAVAHSTHAETIVLHTGTGALQSPLVWHPARHTFRMGSQMGSAVPQSAFERQATQRSSRARHRGEVCGQSELAWHCTHWPVAVSQMGMGPPQSVFALQPTQAPAATLQMWASSGQSPFVLHAGWQSWSPG